MEQLMSAPGILGKLSTRKCKACGAEFESAFEASQCQTCREKERARREAERIEALIDRREESVCGSLWVPPSKFYIDATLATFKSAAQPKAFKAVKAFLEKPIKGLLLWGPPGTGKTHLAAAIFNHYWEKWDRVLRTHPDARFLREYDIFAKLRASYKEKAEETEEEILGDFTGQGSVIIIDDVCKYQPGDTAFRNRIYYELVDRLWAAEGRTLILTANISPDVLAQELGAPTADRIRDMCQVVEMMGQSQRGKT